MIPPKIMIVQEDEKNLGSKKVGSADTAELATGHPPVRVKF
jgi:hypothetical protein